MKKVKVFITILACVLVNTVWAQPATLVGSNSGQAGSIVSVPITFKGTGSGAFVLQVDVSFDNTNLTADITNCGGTLGSANIICFDNTTFIRFIGIGSSEIPDGSLGSIDFTISASATAPSTLPLTLSNELYADSLGNPIFPLGSSDGAVMVVTNSTPSYSSAPPATTALIFNANNGSINPINTVDISNSGGVGSTLIGSCAINGIDAASFSVVNGSPFTITQGSPAQTVEVDCSTAIAGTFNASLDCTHDGSTPASPVSYPLTCNIAAISPQYDSTPAFGAIIPMGPILQGGTNPTASIDINNDNGDATSTLTGVCTTTGPNISIIGTGAFSVLQGETAATIAFECDATSAPGIYSDILSCSHNASNLGSPANYELSCEVLAAAAIGSQNPTDGTEINIIVPPSSSGVATVIFSEDGGQGVDITDLTCSITPGVGFAITLPVAFPATIPADGNLPVEITFTDPGDGSATAGSLDCTYTDGTGSVTVSYPLNFAIQAINIPALSMMGYLVLTLGFGLIGFFAFRRRA